MTVYYKVTNLKENHYGFQYVDGLNVMIHPKNNLKYNDIDSDDDDDDNSNNSNNNHIFKKNTICGNGLYFTIKERIHRYYHMGYWIREVVLPMEDDDFEMGSDLITEKWKANKIILGKKYSLNEISTYIRLQIPFMNMNLASYCGCDKVLDWWLGKIRNGVGENENEIILYDDIPFYSTCAMDTASGNGYVYILNWWIRSGLKLKYSKEAMDLASENGHKNVLDWWLNYARMNKIQLEYSCDAMDSAAEKGHLAILEWWKKSNLEIRYTENALDNASKNGHINILDWFMRSNLPIKYSNEALKMASQNGHINVLNWWNNSKLPLKYNTNECTRFNEHANIINWWKQKLLTNNKKITVQKYTSSHL